MKKTLIIAAGPLDAVLKAIAEHPDAVVLANTKMRGAFGSAQEAHFRNMLSWRSLGLASCLCRYRPTNVVLVTGPVFFHENVLQALHVQGQLLFLSPHVSIVGSRYSVPYRKKAAPLPCLLMAVLLALFTMAVALFSGWQGAVATLSALVLCNLASDRLKRWSHRERFMSSATIRREIELDIGLSDHVSYLRPAIGLEATHSTRPNLDFTQAVHVKNTNLSLSWHCTTDGQGRRGTGGTGAGTGDILVLGCSQSFGHFLDDERTFSALLQAALPELNVYNYAVSGHSLLQMHDILRDNIAAHKARLVVVGYHAELKFRTVAAFGSIVYNPWGFHAAVAEAGKIKRLGLKRWEYFPFRKLPLVALLEFHYNRALAWRRTRPGVADDTAFALILAMREICRKAGARLLLLNMDNAKDMAAFCKEQRVSWCSGLDTSTPDFVASRTFSPIDLHYNAAANIELAQKLIPATRQMLSEGQYAPPLEELCAILGNMPETSPGGFLYPMF